MKDKARPPADKWVLVVVSHSHWDREWYFPFQNFRIRLTRMMDSLIDILDSDPGYRHFMLDGQTIIVRDYLAVRPDRRSDVERLVRAGRLLIGPWFAPPDEHLPGGEALIRNLQMGIRSAAELGGAMMVGHMPDPFGHVAHLPAILAGFGIQDATFWRGADDRVDKTEFYWEAPDGSRVLAVHLALGYGFGAVLPADLEPHMPMLRWFNEELKKRATTPYLLLMNGTDHAPPRGDLPAALAELQSRLPDVKVIHGTLPRLLQSIRRSLKESGTKLSTYRGEMRCGKYGPVLPGAITARMWIKQRNQYCEDLLFRWAEPFSVWADSLRRRLGDDFREPPLPPGPLTGYPSDRPSIKGILAQAWVNLLENQEHDGIYGCSVDEVHRENAIRFDACQQIGEDLTRLALSNISAQADTGGDQGIVVFNPLPGTRSDFVTVSWPSDESGSEPVAVIDPAGRRIPCQIVSRSALRYMSVPGFPARTLELGFMAPSVPGCGYKSFRLVTGPAKPRKDKQAAAAAVENEFFRVEADPKSGAITLHDKSSGRVLRGLNRFVDGGDRGDLYAYWEPARDRLIDAPARPAAVSVVEDGPGRLTLEIAVVYRLPESASDDRRTRSRRLVDCRVTTRVSVHPGVRRVDFRTEVENPACDHRLRVHFPTDVLTDVSHAEQHFGVVTRPVGPPAADETWVEQPVATHTQKAFIDVNDGEKGLLLANRGLPEYEVLPGDDGVTVALTLLRSVGWLCRGDMTTRKGLAGPPFSETPEAQCLGTHLFEYAIVPHKGDWQEGFVEAHRFAVPLQARLAAGCGALPPTAAFIEVSSPKVVVSAVKFPEDSEGVVVRVYNIDDRPVRARLRLREPHGAVEFVDFNEKRIARAATKDGWVPLALRPNQIATLLFRAKTG